MRSSPQLASRPLPNVRSVTELITARVTAPVAARDPHRGARRSDRPRPRAKACTQPWRRDDAQGRAARMRRSRDPRSATRDPRPACSSPHAALTQNAVICALASRAAGRDRDARAPSPPSPPSPPSSPSSACVACRVSRDVCLSTKLCACACVNSAHRRGRGQFVAAGRVWRSGGGGAAGAANAAGGGMGNLATCRVRGWNVRTPVE